MDVVAGLGPGAGMAGVITATREALGASPASDVRVVSGVATGTAAWVTSAISSGCLRLRLSGAEVTASCADVVDEDVRADADVGAIAVKPNSAKGNVSVCTS